MSRYEIRTKLLKAIAACAAASGYGNRRIEGILFRDDEIIASNGHILVRVPAQHGLRLMVPVELANAAVAASLAGDDGQVDCDGYPVSSQNTVYVAADGGDVVIDIGGVKLRAPSLSVDEFPSIKKCTEKSREDGNPMGVLFDPRLMALVGDVLDANGERSNGVHICACGGPHDALVLRSDSGVRFVIMPMRRRDS